ncbi:hypothetical protein LCGC14_1104650 [marine sediment metagenome]|uniref:Uncharacterized protein n=1 Tax=marine sediment metagenome TaxID=412755 RepID=A0A0F9M8I7_9ZZZZ
MNTKLTQVYELNEIIGDMQKKLVCLQDKDNSPQQQRVINTASKHLNNWQRDRIRPLIRVFK